MPANPNIIKANDICKALDIEFVKKFKEEYDRFEEILGLFPSEKLAAGSALYTYEVTGELVDEDGTTQGAKGSSGKNYVEGDFIERSNFKVDKHFFGEMAFMPYAKQTTAQAILKGGFENSILRTDRKAREQLRDAILSDFLETLTSIPHEAVPAPNAAARPKPATIYKADVAGLQYCLAMTEAMLGDLLEAGKDQAGELVHFVNRQDIAGYLATAEITTQTAFGMTYIQDFLGVRNIFVTNKVPVGEIYVTPVENIRIYTMDFAALGAAGLDYATESLGLVGVHHVTDYDYASAETFLVRGMWILPEKENYVVKGVIGTTLNGATVAPESGTTNFWGTLASAMQSDLAVSNGKITGTLNKLTSGQLVTDWGEGYFMALKFTNTDNAPSIKVGMDPSQSSGLAELVGDPDMNGVFKVTDKDAQVFKVITTKGGMSKVDTYDLSELVLGA